MTLQLQGSLRTFVPLCRLRVLPVYRSDCSLFRFSLLSGKNFCRHHLRRNQYFLRRHFCFGSRFFHSFRTDWCFLRCCVRSGSHLYRRSFFVSYFFFRQLCPTAFALFYAKPVHLNPAFPLKSSFSVTVYFYVEEIIIVVVGNSFAFRYIKIKQTSV